MRRLTLILLSILLVLSSLLPQLVYADTQSRQVTGEGSLSFGGGFEAYSGGTADWDNLNSDDADTEYWYGTTAGGAAKRHTWTVQAFAETGTITNVRLSIKARDDSLITTCELTPMVRVSGSNYYGTQVNTADSYTTYNKDWATNPATGLPWTAAQLNAAEFGVRGATGAGVTFRVTYMYVTVTYTPPSLPSVDTDAADDIEYGGASHNATMNGEVTDDGDDDIDCRGFMWGTTSNSTDPGNVIPTDAVINNGYTSNWTECTDDWGEGTFDHTLTGLVACTTYYFRAYAHNSVGWSYGEELSFSTLCSPLIQTQAATYVEATTARLNGLVIDDGGQACDVRFAYGTTSANCTYNATCATGTCNATSYDTVTPWVENTYTTGQTPYVNVSGLAASTTYYFCVQIRNDVACTCGGELSFTTESGINEPSEFKGIPSAEEISLFWVKGPGSTNTLVRYKLGGYPSDVLDGTEVYFDSETSVVHTGLTRGTTYFYKAWGESGGTYSTENVTLMITTLSTPDEADDQPTPGTPDSWFQTPDYTKMSGLPFYGLVNWWAECFEMPPGTLWFLSILGFSLGCAVFAYWKSQKIFVAAAVLLVFMGLSAAMELAPLWVIMPPILIIGVALALGERP